VGSGLLYAIIVGIWALVLLPALLRKHDSNESIRHVDNFRAAMNILSDQLPLADPNKVRPHVSAKRAIRSGVDHIRTQSLARRRRAFFATVSTVPTTLLAITVGHLSLVSLFLPLLAVIGYVVWVRSEINRVRIERRLAARNGGVLPTREHRSHLRAGILAIRRSATARLVATEPDVDTATTTSWQPAEEETVAGWSLPDHVVPTYVTAPAATTVPRQIDLDFGVWDGSALLRAADAQRQQAIAELAAETSASEIAPAPETDLDRTAEIGRLMA